MYRKFDYSAIGVGVIRASILTILFILIYSVIGSFVDIGNTVTSVFLTVITLGSVVYGSIYATLKMGKNGWLVGLIVAACYMIILFIVSLCFGKGLAFGIKDLVRLLLALMAGTLSGMLGVNL